MNITDLDWAAPIIPGKSALGILFGTPLEEFSAALALLERTSTTLNSISFTNSPLLSFEFSNGGYTVRATEAQSNYEWQNKVMEIGFENGVFSFIRVDAVSPLHDYKGKLFGKIGLGDEARELLTYYKSIDYNDAEEWLLPIDGPQGLRVAGSSCDLEQDPLQKIWCICASQHAL